MSEGVVTVCPSIHGMQGDVMKIDCGRCEMRGTGCHDCVVTVLGSRSTAGVPATAAGYLGEEEVKALGVLAAAGMVPPLRFSPPGSAVLPAARAWRTQGFPDTQAS
jgi:hypothetical protein